MRDADSAIARITALPVVGEPDVLEVPRTVDELDAHPPEPDADPLPESVERFANRELSWLDFADRLLDLAADGRQPLLERVKFLAIFAEGLDEFFQVRVAGLEDQVAAGLRTRSPDGLAPGEQLEAISGTVTSLVGRQSRIFADDVAPALRTAGILLTDWHQLDDQDRAHLDDVYSRTIFPILTPLAVDQGHPFPYISNLCLNLVLRVVDPTTDELRIARVKVPPLLERFVALPDGRRFVPVEQIIAAHLDTLFPAMTIVEHHVFRVTRNADLTVDEDDAQDLLAAVELELHRRRFGQAVRLEVAEGISTDLLHLLVSAVDVHEATVFLSDGPIDLGGLRGLSGIDRPDLAPEPWTPLIPPQLAGDRALFVVLAEGEVLLHHPYESFAASVEAFVERAAVDPDVLAIKQTLYRTGTDSPLVAALIRASHSGKQVTAVVELQARFDERANIAWARALEEAGVQVVYGLVGLKTHCKMSLVIRREGDHTRRYCHVGSGNYNSVTALTYEDIGLLTADPDIGADVAEVFNLLTGSGSDVQFRRLVVSPISTRREVISAIDAEAAAGPAGRIVLKTNGLTDPEVIDALYRASGAGASIDLVVRGRCSLRPGVPGLSEHIRVRSIVGRFLEHSRIFRFGGEHGRPLRIWFGSPDMMERNLDRRVEAVVPVVDPAIQQRLVGILDDALRDEANSWTLESGGSWRRVAAPGEPAPDWSEHEAGRDEDSRGAGFSLQDRCRELALAALQRRRSEARAAPSLRSIATQGPAQVPAQLAASVPGERSPAPSEPPVGRRLWHRWRGRSGRTP
jgi:polyphosphate kinase